MKKILPLLLLTATSVGYSQGTVNFNNRVSGIVDAPISYAAGTPLGGVNGTNLQGNLHPTARAALYVGADGAVESQLVLISPPVGFRSGVMSAGYVGNIAQSERVIPGVPAGGFAMVQMRVWDANNGTTASSYETASAISGAYLGKSAVLRLMTGGETNPPANLVGLMAFAITPQISQTISFGPLPNRLLGDSPFVLTASASSGLPVSYTSSDTNVATVSGNTVTIVGLGTTIIMAQQPGDGVYPPAAPVQQTFTVEQTLTLSLANSAAYTFTTLAGYPSLSGADGVGANARFAGPSGVAVDTNGNVYVADSGNWTIRKITPGGAVSTIAGFAGLPGTNDGQGGAARFMRTRGIAADHAGRLYVIDGGGSTVRQLTPAGTNWVVSTIAGAAGQIGTNDGPGSGARFNYPGGVAVDSAGHVYVSDTENDTIRKLTPSGTNWMVSTIAGLALNSGTRNGTGSLARFQNPSGLAVNASGDVYVADTGNNAIRKLALVETNWVVSTVAGLAGSVVGSVDGTNDAARFKYPQDLTVDEAGTLFVADSFNYTVRQLTPAGTNWVVTTLAGRAGSADFGNMSSANGTGTNALFNVPQSIAVDSAGNLYVAETVNNTIRRVTSAGVVSTVAGVAGGVTGSVDGTGSAAQFRHPYGMAVDSGGNIYVADFGNATIRRITSGGVVSTVAGLATNTGSADGVGSNARFFQPFGLAVDGAANLYVADARNYTIRKITAAGVVSTLAGVTQVDASAAGGSADGTNSAARFYFPAGLAVDRATNLYVADTLNHKIRKMTRVGNDWVVTTIAGLAGSNGGGSGSADGTNGAARFNLPQGVAVDSATNLYVADSGNNTIRKIKPVGTNWVVSTLAGLALNSGSTDGTGTNARFSFPQGIAVDSLGNLHVTDRNSSILRYVSPAGVVSTIGGLADETGSADGMGRDARFNHPVGIAVDGAGHLYVADTQNHTIRKGLFTQYTARNLVPYVAPPMSGQLTVTLLPPEANGQWRFPWEFGWRNSGVTASNLVAGNYPIEFRNVAGFLVLPVQPVQVTAGNTTAITNEYLPTLSAGDANSAPGSLTVFLGPTPPVGAGWRFLGASGPFFNTGFTTNLLPGTYLIEFSTVSGRVKPPSQTVQVSPSSPSYLSVNYLLAATPPANVYLPFPVPGNLVGEEEFFPFGFNGQLQSDTGFGSGVAVENNVVLTAAHLVFNDQTLSYVSHAYWFFRRDASVSEPLPLEARGFYLLSGYAAQRTNDLFSGSAPEQSTPPSRNLDVAALYFLLPVAGGGHGGYLPSDAVPNTWLSSTALKMLVGYPVDGSQFGGSIAAGKMYQTDPQPYPLSLATDPVPDAPQVYVAPWFLSYPGNSGGPLYVQLNGSYYPAAVYLGTLFSGSQPYASVVRAIDSNVVNLITLAASQGDSGTNFTGGGVITVIPSQNISANNPGYLQVRLVPPSAVAAGAGWKLGGDASFSTSPSYTRQINSTNAFGVEFKTIPGWNLPGSQSITVLPNPSVPTVVTGYYTVNSPLLMPLRVAGTNRLAMSGTTGTLYRLERKTALTNTTWLPVTTNTIRTNGFNPVLTNPPPGFYRLNWLTNF